jgi:uncharacterized protein DUF4031
VTRGVTIGVDRLFQAKGRWWCHLLCDDFSDEGLAALHRFAREINVPPQAFHDPSGHPRPHYDLRPEYRELALSHGAIELLSHREVVNFLKRGREAVHSDG